MKTTIAKIVLSSALCISVAYAANQHSGLEYLSKNQNVPKTDYSTCGYNNTFASNVCINNNTNGMIGFGIPLMNLTGSLPTNNQWSVDAYSSQDYPMIGVVIWGTYAQPLFFQMVDNDSTIDIGLPQSPGGKPVITIRHI